MERLRNLLVFHSKKAQSSKKASCENDEFSEPVLGLKPTNHMFSDRKTFKLAGHCILLPGSPQSNA